MRSVWEAVIGQLSVFIGVSCDLVSSYVSISSPPSPATHFPLSFGSTCCSSNMTGVCHWMQKCLQNTLPGVLHSVQRKEEFSVQLLSTRAACSYAREAHCGQHLAETGPCTGLACCFQEPLRASNCVKLDLSIWVAAHRGWRELI